MPLKPEDHLAILNLLSRYNHAIDLRNPDLWADCFTEDGEFDARPVTHCHGRAELHDFAARSLGRTRHWNTNVMVEGDGDRATSHLYLMTVTPGADAKPGVTGVYTDQLVKQDGQWKIQKRHLVFEQPPHGYGK
jgi:uncharacterized protein (TIGR02246 family)